MPRTVQPGRRTFAMRSNEGVPSFVQRVIASSWRSG
jgi:hypothetical protein